MQPRRHGTEVTLAVPAWDTDAAIARAFGVPLAKAGDDDGWQLVRSANCMQLRGPAGPNAIRLEMNLQSGSFAKRLRGSRRDEPLPRAIGLHRRAEPPTVVDATGGLCRDAMVLAQLGCQVTAIERIAGLAMLAFVAIEPTPLAGRLRILAADAVEWLRQALGSARPAVVYLDPMFAESGRVGPRSGQERHAGVPGAGWPPR